MRTLSRAVFILGAAVLLGACATSGPKFSEASARQAESRDPETARIYVYRTALIGAAVQPEVKVNGIVVGRAVPNGYFYVDQQPGPCEITTTTEVERKLTLTLDKAQVRYVRLNLSFGFVVGHVYPELIEEEVALKEMQDLRFTGK